MWYLRLTQYGGSDEIEFYSSAHDALQQWDYYGEVFTSVECIAIGWIGTLS